MAATAIFMAAAPAQAVTISYGGQSATDGSGLTSKFVPANNLLDGTTGYLIETFDSQTVMTGYGAPLTTSVNTASTLISMGLGGQFNSYNTIKVTTTGGGLGIQSGSNGSGARPAGDTTNYGFGPSPGGSLPASVMIDYSPLLTQLGADVRISYLGVYYGSIDTYNDIIFYSGDKLLTTVTGSSVLNGNLGSTGDQFKPGSNVYVNMAFGVDETFTALKFVTSGVAFEVDNIVIGLTTRNVPEPCSIALLGLGLFGIGALRRRKL